MQQADALREIAFSDRDFIRVREMLYARVGISMNESKRQLVFNRLSKRIRTTDLASFSDYLDLVEQDAAEQEQFINALTTNLTSFFREPYHFPVLAQQLQRLPKGRPINIWCSASSTGEEPYSIAITVLETLGATEARRVRILASDLDTHVLDKARAGIYRQEQISKLGVERARRFFLRGTGRNHGMAKTKPELKSMITFRQINLLAPDWRIDGQLDAIFCRNVMIYFDKETQLKVLERFMPLLRPDGLLYAGHSESFAHASHLIRACGRSVYCQAGTPT
jgi:chemotaxis protein methyltransferase CheR